MLGKGRGKVEPWKVGIKSLLGLVPPTQYTAKNKTLNQRKTLLCCCFPLLLCWGAGQAGDRGLGGFGGGRLERVTTQGFLDAVHHFMTVKARQLAFT